MEAHDASLMRAERGSGVRARSGGSVEQGHTVQPGLASDPSPLSTLASTLRGWAPFDARSTPSAVPISSPAAPMGAGGPGRTAAPVGEDLLESQTSDALMRDDDESGGEEKSAPAGCLDANVEPGERITWAKWDDLMLGSETRRVLILGYRRGGLAVWDCSNLDSWSEVLNLASVELPKDGKPRSHSPSQPVELVAASVLPSPATRDVDPESQHPFLALVTRSASDSHAHSPTSQLSLYSLRTHRIVSTVSFPGIAHRISTSRRFAIVSTSSPLALHVYRLSRISVLPTLEPAPFSPILDISAPPPSSASAGPVFSLGSSGRLLAYSTSTPILSSKLDRSPARPGTNILAHKGLFEPDLPNLLATPSASSAMGVAGFAVQEAPEVARRVGEGVISGVNALREAGMGYWTQRRASEGGEPGAGGGSTLSRSAPQQVGMLGRKMSSPTATRPTSGYGEGENIASGTAGTIVVVDLLSPAPPSPARPSSRATAATSSPPPLKVVHHFRPYAQPVAHLSFSPSSTTLLTATSTGHHFDVFELKPAVAIGTSATSSPSTASPIASSGLGKVWHRQRLQRGYTSASTVDSSWSVDGRFVAVSTGKGTGHVYAVEPNGGVPNLEDHFQPKVVNSQELPGLSVPLNSVARIRHPLLAMQASDQDATQALRPATVLPVSIAFLPKATSLASSLAPSSVNKRDAGPPSLQDVLVFRPSLGSSTLYRLTPVEAAPFASVAESAARGDVGKLATTAVSGLTQMMKTRGAGLLKDGLGGLTRAPEGKEVKKSWSAQTEAVAEWKLGREEGWPEVREEIRGMKGGESGQRAGSGVTRYSAQAEIETFSRSPLVLPRSIYQTQQFDFFSLPADHEAYTRAGSSALPLRRLEVRSEVQIRPVEGAVSSDVSPSLSPALSARRYSTYSASSSFEPASFDQPIKNAMQTFLEAEAMLAPGSPNLPTPTFPNGVPGKHGSWRDSIPIPRKVGPAAIEGIGKVRQGLGQIRVPKGIMSLPGRRASSSTSIGQAHTAAYSSSISFEDDDAVFADHAVAASASTAYTSDIGSCGGVTKVDGVDAPPSRDEEDWGWDDRLDEPAHTGGTTTTRPASTALDLSTPFEDDFDHFELELPSASPFSLKPPTLAVPSPLALEPVDAPVNTHLAPPVQSYSTSMDAASSSTSSSPAGHICLDKATAPSSPRHLLDQPSSALSSVAVLAPKAASLATPVNSAGNASPAPSSGSSSGGGKKKKKR